MGLTCLAVILCMSLVGKVDGLYAHSFTKAVQGSIGPFSVYERVTATNTFSYDGEVIDNFEIHPNRYIVLNDVSSNTPLSGGPDITITGRNVVGPLWMQTSGGNAFVYRLIDCLTLVGGKEYVSLDCSNIKRDLARALNENHYEWEQKLVFALIVTWKIDDGSGNVNYLQAVLAATLTDTYVMFLYEGDYTNLVGSSDEPRFVIATASGAIVSFAEDGTSLDYAGFNSVSPTLSTLASHECSSPGIVIVSTTSLSESVSCSIDASDVITAGFYFQYLSGETIVGLESTGAQMTGTCEFTVDENGAVEVLKSADDFVTDCAATYNSVTGQLTGKFCVVSESDILQRGDFVFEYTCFVNDIPDTLNDDITVGTVPSQTVPPTITSTVLGIVSSTGLNAAEVTSCSLGELLVLQITFVLPDPYLAQHHPYGLIATTCKIFNYDPSSGVTPPSVPTTIAGVTVPPTEVIIIQNKCPNTGIAGKAFEISGGFGPLGSPPAGTFVTQSGTFKCAKFKGVARFYVQCDLSYCSEPEVECQAASTCGLAKRRRRSVVETLNTTTTVTTSMDIIIDKEVEEGNCIDNSAAIGTIAGLIIGLILASGLTVGALVKAMTRSVSRRKSIS